MLNHWVLANNFCVKHLLQTLSNFVPTWNGGYIVEHRGRFVESTVFLHVFDKFDASKVHVIVTVVQSTYQMDAFR